MKVRLILAVAPVLFVCAMAVTPASAQYTGGTPPNAGPVAGSSAQGDGTGVPVAVQVDRTGSGTHSNTGGSGFALTGADIAQMALIAGALVLGGAALVRQSRRRVTASGS